MALEWDTQLAPVSGPETASMLTSDGVKLDAVSTGRRGAAITPCCSCGSLMGVV